MGEIVIGDADAAKLQQQIDACNGNRKKLRLSYDDALQAAAEASTDPHGIGVRHAGQELLGRTTIALAVKTPKGIVVGVQGVWADKPTPGRAWKDLQPWMADFAKNVERARAWAKQKGKDRVTVTLGKAREQARPAGDGAKLLAAILDDPQDTQARLVYADWLTEQGDPRGELITIQCAKKRTPAMTKREQELLKKHHRAWSKEATQDSDAHEFERGFVGTVEMSGTAWASKGAKLLAREPITTLRISDVTSTALLAVAGAAHTAKLARIEADKGMWMRTPKDATALTTFLKSKYVGAVRDLEFHVSRERDYLVRRDPVDCSALFDGVTLPGVERLAIRIDKVPDSALASLLTISAPKLRELRIGISKAKQKAQLAALKKKFPRAEIS